VPAIPAALDPQLVAGHAVPEELGDRVGKNRSTVTNYLRLLKLPPDIQIALRDDKLSMGHARAIISVENPDTQLFIFKQTLKEELSVRQVEELARQVSGGSSNKPEATKGEATAPSKEMNNLQTKLSSHFGTKVSIKSNGRKGEIKIPFLSVEDLNRILLDPLQAHGERRGVGVADAPQPWHPQHRIVQFGQRQQRHGGDAQHLHQGVGQRRHHPGDLDRPGQ